MNIIDVFRTMSIIYKVKQKIFRLACNDTVTSYEGFSYNIHIFFSYAGSNVLVRTIPRRNENNDNNSGDNDSVKFIFWYRCLSKSVVSTKKCTRNPAK